MITVTERAKVILQGLLHQKINVPLACLRITLNEKGGLGLGVDVEVAGDQGVIFEGETILIIGERLAEKLDQAIIDIEKTDDGYELVLIESVAKMPVTNAGRLTS